MVLITVLLDHSGRVVIAVCSYIFYYVMCDRMIGVLEQRITIGPQAVSRPFWNNYGNVFPAEN